MKYEIADNFHKFFDETLPVISFRFMSTNDYTEKQVKIIISGALNSFFVGNEKIVSADLYKIVLSRNGIYFRKIEAEDENGVYYIYEIVLSTEDIEHPNDRPYRSFYHEFKNYLTTNGEVHLINSLGSDVFSVNFFDLRDETRGSLFCDQQNDIRYNGNRYRFFNMNYQSYMSVNININKKYKSNDMTKITLRFYNDLIEFNQRETGCLMFYSLNCCSPCLREYIYRSDGAYYQEQNYIFEPLVDGKLLLEKNRGIYILSDGKTAREHSSYLIDRITSLQVASNPIKMIVINQFHPVRLGLIVDLNNDGGFLDTNKIVCLRFVNSNRLLTESMDFRNSEGTGTFSANVASCYGKKKKYCQEAAFLRSYTKNCKLYGAFLIPVSEDDYMKKVYETVFSLISNGVHSSPNYEVVQNYKQLLLGVAVGTENPDDVLSTWFKNCTTTSKKTDNDVLVLYKQMKAELEKEYKEISGYLGHFNYSSCLPVPKVIFDDCTVKNYYNTIHIEEKKDIINKIKNENIKPIEVYYTTVNTMFMWKKKWIVSASIPYKKLYDNKTNTLDLTYKRLKGETWNDKIKSRR